MHVTRIASPAGFTHLAPEWDALAGGVPFRTHAWLESWWRHYSAGRELYVLAVRDDAGALRGVAPWYLETQAAAGRTLKFLGSGEVCSDYLSLLTRPGNEREVASALASWLTLASEGRTSDMKPHAWDLLELEAVANDDVATPLLTEALTEGGCTVHQRAALTCWRIALPATWDEYMAGLSKSHRKQTRRVERGLLDSGAAVLHTASTPEELSRAFDILVDLHQRRRISLGQPGCFADARFAGFLRLAAERLLAQNALRLHWIELAGRPVAAEFHLASEGITYAYQAGVEPEALEEEPGRLMNIAVLKDALARGDRAFDFLRGDEPYKAHWRADPRGNTDWRIVPPRASAQLRHGLWLAGDAMKHFVKAGLEMAGVR